MVDSDHIVAVLGFLLLQTLSNLSLQAYCRRPCVTSRLALKFSYLLTYYTY